MSNLGTLGSLFVDLAANTATFESDLGRASRISEKRAREIGKQFDEMGKRLGIALAATGAVVAAGVAKAIRDADQLGKVAQKTAISVEALSKIKFAASMEDVDFGSLETALIKFNKAQVEAISGSKEQAAAFAAVGITVEDLKRLNPDELLLKVADAFESAKGNASKTALVMALFGKSGADLIPLLNKGSAAIREQGEVLKRLGGVITSDMAEAADQFGDNLDLLKVAANGLFVKLGTELTPELVEFTNRLSDPEFQKSLADTAKGMAEIVSVVAMIPQGFSRFGTFIGEQAARLTGAVDPEIELARLRKYSAEAKEAGRMFDYQLRERQIAELRAKSGASLPKQAFEVDYRRGLIDNTPAAISEGRSEYVSFSRAVDQASKASLIFGQNQAEAAEKLKKVKLELDDHAQALIESEKRYRELGKTLTEQVMTPVETYLQTMDQLDDALAQGAISEETFARQVSRTAQIYVDAQLAQSRAAEESARSMALEIEALAELERRKADRAIRSSPTARVFGVDSLEELEQRSDVMKAAALDLGDAMNGAFSSASASLGDLVTNMILFGDKGELSVKKVAAALVQDTVRGFVQVGIQMVANEALASVLSKKRVAESTVEGPAIAAAYAPAAASTSIATFGQSALIGLAAIIGTLAASRLIFGSGRANGGPVQAGRLYEVGEMNFPELAYFQGKQYLIPGNQGGMVKPLDAGARSVAGGGSTRAPNVQIVNAGAPINEVAPAQFDGQTLKLFVDTAVGAVLSDATNNGPITSTSNARIGARRLPTVAGRR